MNLRKKTVLLVSFIIFSTLAATILTSNFVVLSGFNKIEHDDAVTQVERATNALNAQTISLDTFVVDYATWDDTYQFIQDNNTQFIENNVIDETFQHSNLNLMMYVNSTGTIVYSKMYGIEDLSSESPIQNIPDYLIGAQLWRLDENRTYARGFITVGGNMLIVASRPILKSDAQGPILGALIMARQVTPESISRLEDQTHLQIKIAQISSAELSPDFLEAKQNLLGYNTTFVKPANETILNCYSTITDVNGNQEAILEVSIPRDIYSQGLTTINTFVFLTVVWFALLGSVMIVHLERSVVSRVLKLTSSVSKISEAGSIEHRGILSDPKFSQKKDELSSLSKSINGMLDRIQDVSTKLQKSQKMAAVGELSVMVAHDLRNPLQGIKIAADCLNNEKIADPKKKEKLAHLIGRDVVYCEKIVNDLLGYSGNIKIIPTETDVKTLLSSSLSHLQMPENIKINDLTQSEPKINLDVEKITRVFDNLIKNAFDAMPQGGSLTVKSESLDHIVRITFADTGNGIDKEHMAKLFTPLFTTKAKGMGFGLAICQRIIEAHKGKISVESTLNIGTTFTIEIPLNIDAERSNKNA
jgi:signal transduction histidine kinase